MTPHFFTTAGFHGAAAVPPTRYIVISGSARWLPWPGKAGQNAPRRTHTTR